MGYESLSTVVVLAIVVILMVGWLPRRTVKGMKRVIEHREDRFSPSLHLVDADSGTRFSDVSTPQAKGAIMQSSEAQGGRMSEEHIAQVRTLRRAAIRRRRIIVVALNLSGDLAQAMTSQGFSEGFSRSRYEKDELPVWQWLLVSILIVSYVACAIIFKPW